MPHEVADSDDESSEIITPAFTLTDPSASATAPSPSEVEGRTDRVGGQFLDQIDQPPPSTLERDPLANVDFDEYLSPTQRISSGFVLGEEREDEEVHVERGEEGGYESIRVLDSSTDRFLDEVAPLSKSETSHTRSKSSGGGSAEATVVEGSMAGKRMGDSMSSERQRKKTKTKAKTYGKARTHQPDLSEGQEEEIANEHDAAADVEEGVSVDTPLTEPLDVSLDMQVANATRSSNLSNGYHPYTPHSNYNAMQYGTTSTSSVGGYQSFTINPNAMGIGFNDINPFGRLSQASMDEATDTDGTRGIASIFHSAATSGSAPTSFRHGSHKSGHVSVEQLMATNMQDMQSTSSREAKDRATPARDLHKEPSETSPPFSPITERDEVPIETVVVGQNTAGVMKVEPMQAPKKRGRKPKGDMKSVNQDDDNTDELQMDEHSALRRARASTIDSVSNVSEMSHDTTSSKKRKRETKKAKVELPPSEKLKKLPSSDLGLDNKAVIGYSPERYKPRPSRRRGRNADPDLDIAREVELIENAHKKAQSQHGSEREDTVEPKPEEAPPVQPKGKRDRKPKVKKSQILEEEVQATTTAGDLIVVEDEAVTGEVQEEEEDMKSNVEGESKPTRKPQSVSVDIPALPKPPTEEVSQAAAEPKKRGRKKKEKIPTIVEDEPEPGTEAEPERSASRAKDPANEPCTKDDSEDTPQEGSRPPLTEKDPNRSHTSTTSPPPSDVKRPPLPTTTQPTQSQTPTPSRPTFFTTPSRIGLSRTNRIPSLLRKIDRNKEPPKMVEKKEKLTAAQQREREKERIEREEAEANGEVWVDKTELRDRDGRLVEWDF